MLAVLAAVIAAACTASAGALATHSGRLVRDAAVGPASLGTVEGLPGASAASSLASYAPGEVLVGFRDGVSAARERAIEHAAGASAAWQLGPRTKPLGHGRTAGQEYLAPLELRVPAAHLIAAVERLRRDPAVAYAEPNYLQTATAKPTTPRSESNGAMKTPASRSPSRIRTRNWAPKKKARPGPTTAPTSRGR